MQFLFGAELAFPSFDQELLLLSARHLFKSQNMVLEFHPISTGGAAGRFLALHYKREVLVIAYDIEA